MFDFSGVRLRVHIYENRRKERERKAKKDENIAHIGSSGNQSNRIQQYIHYNKKITYNKKVA